MPDDPRPPDLIGVDLASKPSITSWLCVCGYECDNGPEMIARVQAHGVQAVLVTPARTGKLTDDQVIDDPRR